MDRIIEEQQNSRRRVLEGKEISPNYDDRRYHYYYQPFNVAGIDVDRTDPIRARYPTRMPFL